jgi:DUF4097 and DUF4098 domain-containing protein YvlB
MKMKTPFPLAAALLAGASFFAQARLAASGYEQSLEKSFAVSPGGKLIIQADRGAIGVATDASNRVRVKVFREVKGGSKAHADGLFANHEVTFAQDGNTLSVTARNKKDKTISWGREPGLQVRYEVSVPKKFDVDLTTAGGDVRIAELDGGVTAHTTSGSIQLPSVTGRVEARDAGGDIAIGQAGADVVARTTSGSITVKKAGGKVDASDAGGDIRVAEAGGDVVANTTSGSVHVGLAQGKSVRIRNAGGNIQVGEAAGDVSAETTSGTIQIQAARGNIEAKDAGGDITIGEANAVLAKTTSGSISIKKAEANVEARNAGGDISLGQVAGATDARTSSGSVVIALAVGKLTVRNAGGGIKVADARDAVTAETSSGSIEVNFSTSPKSDCRLAVAGGGIKAALPKSAAVDLDAKTSGGKVRSDLPVTMTVSGGQRSGVLAGKINGGGPALVLRASSGDIHLKESPSHPIAAEAEVLSK